jgi:hypothetical protein
LLNKRKLKETLFINQKENEVIRGTGRDQESLCDLYKQQVFIRERRLERDS